MKKSLLILAVLAFAVTAFAATDLTPVTVQATQDSASVGVDVLAIGEAVSDSQWTGFNPQVWWVRNVQPVQFVKQNWKGIATAAALAGAYAIYEHNQDSGGSSSKAAADEDAVPAEPARPLNEGDQNVASVVGSENVQITIYNYSPLGMAAIPE